MIAITLDVDWAPDPIMESVIEVFESYQVPTTLFCTNYVRDRSGKSSSLTGRFHERHELALHPNFEHIEDYDQVWDELLQLYPSARGWRGHNGMTGWPIVEGAVKRGLTFEVHTSVFASYVPPSRANKALDRYWLMPTAFYDSHAFFDPTFIWSVGNLPLRDLYGDKDKVVVLGFHPNILYYDMKSQQEYDERKETYHTADEASSFKTRKARGAMKLLIELLNTVPKQHFCNLTSFGAQTGSW